jgi:7-cyano-7-deazaguanine synthase in queuosine biosynthesis
VNCVGFEVLTAVSMKIAVFWVVAPCRAMMEAARTSETLVNFYQTTRCYNPEDSNLQCGLCFKSTERTVSSFK